MVYTITERCTGCGVCAKKCPVEAIQGERKTQHTIDAALCIDCGICGNLCPQSAVLDPDGEPAAKRKLSARPKAVVDVELCSGCQACVGICPESCLVMEPYPDPSEGVFFEVAVVVEKRCIGCGLCETICIKEAVLISRQDHAAATG